ncbi:hypothetical protein B0O99DRAFT_683477 [Bisporella sp. PMI_857]|nr:hypothetical protein B0O99DRAFT_683477 [Bisporella sp. PMI_857]
MAPIILLTPTDGMSPFIIGTPVPTNHVPWNRKLLILLWFTQALVLLMTGYACFFLILAMMMEGKVFNFFIFLFNWVGNFAFLAIICVEIYRYRKGELEIRKFHKLQIQKAVFVGSIHLFMLSQRGFGAFLFPGVLLLILKKVAIIGPFVASLVYARRVLNEDIKTAEAEEREGHGDGRYVVRHQHIAGEAVKISAHTGYPSKETKHDKRTGS